MEGISDSMKLIIDQIDDEIKQKEAAVAAIESAIKGLRLARAILARPSDQMPEKVREDKPQEAQPGHTKNKEQRTKNKEHKQQTAAVAPAPNKYPAGEPMWKKAEFVMRVAGRTIRTPREIMLLVCEHEPALKEHLTYETTKMLVSLGQERKNEVFFKVNEGGRNCFGLLEWGADYQKSTIALKKSERKPPLKVLKVNNNEFSVNGAYGLSWPWEQKIEWVLNKRKDRLTVWQIADALMGYDHDAALYEKNKLADIVLQIVGKAMAENRTFDRQTPEAGGSIYGLRVWVEKEYPGEKIEWTKTGTVIIG